MERIAPPGIPVAAPDDAASSGGTAPSGWWASRRRTLPGLVALASVAAMHWLVGQLLAITDLLARFGLDVDGAASLPPDDTPPVLTALLLAPLAGLLICWAGGWARARRRFAFAVNAVATLSVANHVTDLLASITERRGNTGAALLLLDAGTIWAMNLLVFTVWYWMLDSGGPEARARGTSRPDVAFAQQQSDFPGWAGWTPRFADYLHLAFRVNISFDNGDVLLLSRRVKLLSMVQAAMALVVIGMLAARAIGAFAA